MRFKFAGSQIFAKPRIFANSVLFLLFLMSLDGAAFWSCSRKCLRRVASPLCRSLFFEFSNLLISGNSSSFLRQLFESFAFICFVFFLSIFSFSMILV